MSVLPVGFGSALGGYQIERSLRFNSADSAYLNRTPASAGNRKTWTWSGWVKANNVTTNQVLFDAYSSSTSLSFIRFSDPSGSLRVYDVSSNVTQFNYESTSLYRDFSAWYHIVVAVDTTQATAGNRVKIYVNGVQITAFSASTNPSQNYDGFVNNTIAHDIGRSGGNSSYLNGYLTEINFIDGQALTPSSFGETDSNTGVWKPKAFSGTYGTNGFYLKFADNSGTTSTTLGKDSSGNGNNWTPNNFSVTAGSGNDSLVDSPTSYGTDTGVGGEVRGNYATLNPLAKGAGVVLSDGNLGYTSNATYRVVLGSIAVASGKYYWEVTAPSNAYAFGVADVSYKIFDSAALATGNLFSYSSFDGDKYIGLSFTESSYDASGGISTSTVLGFAVDFDTGTATIYRNGVSKGVIHTWTPGATYAPFAGYDTTPSGVAYYNFGQRAFAYTAPSGFKALCTQNLPTPTIGATSTTQANDYFDTTLYTGTGSDLAIVNSGGMAPDFVWVKVRNQAFSHNLNDIIRGTNNRLQSDVTAAAGTTGIVSFNSNGFTTRGASGELGANGNTYVAWQWKGGGTGVSNTAGTITSTVSASTTSGFSIVTYTGTGSSPQSIGHGLGATPAMIILKSRSATSDWYVNHVSIGTNDLRLNLTNASAANNFFSAKSSTTFTINFNQTGDWVAYCFAPVAGYSAFGSYVGNGSSDGPFVYLGFRPRWIMIKDVTTAYSWNIVDTARDPYNVTGLILSANTSDTESNYSPWFDINSNGFKVRSSLVGANTNGDTFIYAAFAEFPFKYALAR